MKGNIEASRHRVMRVEVRWDGKIDYVEGQNKLRIWQKLQIISTSITTHSNPKPNSPQCRFASDSTRINVHIVNLLVLVLSEIISFSYVDFMHEFAI